MNTELMDEKEIKGVRIKKFSTWSIIISIIFSAFFIFISIKGVFDFHSLERNTEQLIACEKAAHNLQTGSDVLTNDVRLFVMTGEKRYMDSYFVEANETRSREKALEEFKTYFPDNEFMTDLESALNESKKLMRTEYYAMRLMSEAKGFDKSELDKEVNNIVLSSEDSALSDSEKILRAQNLVSNDNYEQSKTTISNSLNTCLDNIVAYTENRQSYYFSVFKDVLIKLEIGLLLLIVMLLVNSIIVRKLVVKPLVSYNESIEKDLTFPVIGAVELQSLAKKYNKVYEENLETQKIIRHEAEYDALTDLLNRGSFNKILPIYLNGNNPFALIIIDIDSFKFYNDNYGHDTGDNVLKRVANHIKSTFRSEDYIFRIGGDEFAIIVIDMPNENRTSIAERLNTLKLDLLQAEDNLPSVTISSGVAFSDKGKVDIFKRADKALYYVKKHGRNNYKFCDEIEEKYFEETKNN